MLRVTGLPSFIRASSMSRFGVCNNNKTWSGVLPSSFMFAATQQRYGSPFPVHCSDTRVVDEWKDERMNEKSRG
eukprot:scaffold4852_cov76-Cylindrotheca_fusiformis.AAC.2